jgi:putative transcriptional regulator
MNIRWRLRMAAAQREVWTGAQLRRLLIDKAGLELSSASISALMTKQPAQVKLETLAALCTALDCTPNDLFEVDTTPAQRPVTQVEQRHSIAAGETPPARRQKDDRRTPPPF